MGKSLNGKELGRGITQRKDDIYQCSDKGYNSSGMRCGWILVRRIAELPQRKVMQPITDVFRKR